MKKLFVENNSGGAEPRRVTVTNKSIKEENLMKKLVTVILSLSLILGSTSALAIREEPGNTSTEENIVVTDETNVPEETPETSELVATAATTIDPSWEKFNLTLDGADENGSIQYLDGRWARARRAVNDDYLTWSINKMFQGGRPLTEGESLVQAEADVVRFNLANDLYGSLSFRVDPEALNLQVGEDGQKQDKTPYVMALNGYDNGILAAFISLKEEYRGETVLVEYINSTTGVVFKNFTLMLHKLALRGGPTVDNTAANQSWVGNFGFQYLDPSDDGRDMENSYVELPPSGDYIVKVSGNLAAVDWINIGILLPAGSEYDGQSGELNQ